MARIYLNAGLTYNSGDKPGTADMRRNLNMYLGLTVRMCLTIQFSISLVIFATCTNVIGQESTVSPRLTPLVKVIRDIEPAIVALFTPKENQLITGSGTVIHEDGYVLTNNHVLPMAEGFALLQNAKPMKFRVVGRIPESDIAVIRLLDVTTPLSIVPIGRSEDLMNGESVVVAGNPGGRGTVFTSGIVSSKSVLEGGPNALVMTNYENSRRDRFIQFDAASNRGNSGGPLVNMEGRIIGIVSAGVQGEQNVGFAIPIDRVRKQFAQMLESELIHQKSVGLNLDSSADQAVIFSVEDESAAAEAGLRSGDIMESVNGVTIRHDVDWLLMLEKFLPQSGPLQVVMRRDNEVLEVDVNPRSVFANPAVQIEPIAAGLSYSFYHGAFNQMPDFSKLSVERSGVTSKLNIKEIHQQREDHFGITFEGLLKIEADGLYRLIIVSDDGSRLFLDGKLLIDHDGNHPPKPAGGLTKLQKGLHPLRIEYFQGNGEKSLGLFIEYCSSRETVSLRPPTEITAAEYFHPVDESEK